MIFETKKHIAGTSEPAAVDAFDAAFEARPNPLHRSLPTASKTTE